MYGSANTGSQMRRQQQERETNLRTGTNAIDTAFKGFDQGFYDARAKAYENYALPTLGEEYVRANSNLAGQMADRGLFRSSAYNSARANLAQTIAKQKRNIVDEGIRQAQSLQGEVERNRSTLLNQLYATNDPSLAQSQALATASSFNAPSPFAPVGGFLNDWSNIYLTKQLANIYGNTDQQQGQRPRTMFASAPTTVTNVR